MGLSYLPRWKFTDSCGQPHAPSAIHLGCAHDSHSAYRHATRRELLKTGVAIVGAAGFATILDQREVIAQGRVFSATTPGRQPDRRTYGYSRTHRARRLRPCLG
jgi:hypothetical protein